MSKEVKHLGVVARDGVTAFVAHGVLAATVLLVDRYRTGGANFGGWDGVRLLNLLELPVLWAIDGTLQRRFLFPLLWFYPNFELASIVNVIATYALIGGTFYAALAVGFSVWVRGSASD